MLQDELSSKRDALQRYRQSIEENEETLRKMPAGAPERELVETLVRRLRASAHRTEAQIREHARQESWPAPVANDR